MRSNLFLFFATLLHFSTATQAQEGEKVPGYVILEDGEKIEGFVKVGSITDNETRVVFYDGKTKLKTIYKPADLQGYGYEGYEIDELGDEIKANIHYDRQKVDYPPKPFGSTTVFMQKEEEGAVTLYCYYIEAHADVKTPFRYFYYLMDSKGRLEKVEKDDFTTIAKTVFSDYTALANRLGSKDFTYRNLDRMVRDYNYWTVNQHNKTEYRVAMKEK